MVIVDENRVPPMAGEEEIVVDDGKVCATSLLLSHPHFDLSPQSIVQSYLYQFQYNERSLRFLMNCKE